MSRRHRNYRTNVRGPAGPRIDSPEVLAIKAEQDAINKLLLKMYPDNPRLLKVDGIAGPATTAMRNIMAHRFPPENGESLTQAMQRTLGTYDSAEARAERETPEGIAALANTKEAIERAPERAAGSGFNRVGSPTPDAVPPTGPGVVPPTGPVPPAADRPTVPPADPTDLSWMQPQAAVPVRTPPKAIEP